MLTTPHATAGIALGTFIGNPMLIVPAAIASHFILDAVPHWQETLAPYTPTRLTYVRVAFDIALAVGLNILAVHWRPAHTAGIWLGVISANLPDLDSIIPMIPSMKRGPLEAYWDWHCRIQRETKSLWGILPQLLVIGGSLIISYRA